MPGSERPLARVSYFPGVEPPSEPFEQSEASVPQEVAAPEDAGAESAGERSARAANISMHALTRRGVSSREMTRLLLSRELPEPTVQEEVARLERVGLLDDRELASNLVRSLHERKGLGRSAITAELRRRQVDDDAITNALDEIDGDDELARARELAIKRAPQLRSFDGVTARRRLSAFLMRRGYSGAVVSAAVDAALNAAPAAPRGPRFE